MGKMSELHSLVQDAYHLGEHNELENLLKGYGFKNPKLAANEFVKAFTDLEEKPGDRIAKKIKKNVDKINGASVGIRDEY